MVVDTGPGAVGVVGAGYVVVICFGGMGESDIVGEAVLVVGENATCGVEEEGTRGEGEF